jgi:hypothetical protein
VRSHPITFDQYEAYTPEKLELWDGFYDYGDPEDFKGFCPQTGDRFFVYSKIDFAQSK